MTTPRAKAIFGLGVTQCSSFLVALNSNSSLSKYRVDYVSSVTSAWPKKAEIVVVDGLKSLIRHNDKVTAKQVLIISDTPALLRQVAHIEALDYTVARSFEFLFQPVNMRRVLSAMKSSGTVEVNLSSASQLGYHVDSVRKHDNMVAKFVALTSNLDFAQRETLYTTFIHMCEQPKYNPGAFYAAIDKLPENEFIDAAIEAFLDLFEVQGKNYYQAIRSPADAPIAAKQFGVDAYGVSYFRHKVRAVAIAKNRIPKRRVA